LSKKPKTTIVHVLNCNGVLLTVPRGEYAKTEFLTRKKRVLPTGFDEAVAKFETELAALTDGEPLTPDTWGGKGKLRLQANLKAAAAVLMTFGVSEFPVPADQEARARALAGQGEPVAG
jgi:hypothetical protein